jgi:isopentenyl-diphosphate delta-isomerase
MEQVILVDDCDREIGVEEKLAAHRGCGRLHRAFSTFVFDRRGRMLLQQRSPSKYHFGGLWANACCGHPRPGESTDGAAHRRLVEELGFDTELSEAFAFTYSARDARSGLSEREFDHVFIGEFDGEIAPNEGEIAAVRWVERRELELDLAARPELYAPWFREAVAQLSVHVPRWGAPRG